MSVELSEEKVKKISVGVKRENSFKRKMQLVSICKPGHENRLKDFLRTLKCSGYKKLSESCGLSVVELEGMASRQSRQLETQEQLLAAKAQRLRYLKSGGGEADKLQRLREKVATQEERLRKLRALRGKVALNRNGNTVLNADLESLRAVFNEKEKELSVAVAKVDELTRQLEDLRRGGKESGGSKNSNSSIINPNSPASIELVKLRRELLYRQKLREAQATRVAAQRAALSQRQEESNRVDRRIAELQERLHRKRLLNHQLAATLKHQENGDEYMHIENSPGVPNKNDPKYQTLPYNAKLFNPFDLKTHLQHQTSLQQEQDQEKYERAIQQMQIITLDSQKSSQTQGGNNNKIQSQQNYAKTHSNSQFIQKNPYQNSESGPEGLSGENNNKLGTNGHHILSNGAKEGYNKFEILNGANKFDTSIEGSFEKSANGYPLVRPSNFLPTGASSPQIETNGLPNNQSGIKEGGSSAGSNNGSCSEHSFDGLSSSSQLTQNNNLEGKQHRPALPPKPSKPALPSRQNSNGDYFQHSNQRNLSSGEGSGMISDRTELPIKPKPLFIKKLTGNSSANNISSVQNPTGASSGQLENSNNTVRVSINRRIEMPPAFLFPENDPPSDLVPEIPSSTPSSISSSISSSSLHENKQSSDTGIGTSSPHDSIDASPLTPHKSKNEERNSFDPYENYSKNGILSLEELGCERMEEGGGGMRTFEHSPEPESEQNGLEPINDNYLHQNMGCDEEEEEKHIISQEGEVVRENNNINSSESVDEFSYSNESSSFNNNNSQIITQSLPSPLSVPGIIRRVKKTNLRAANKEPSQNGRRVSFDPLALLLDASLEGELDLVMKTANEVGNPSAANDEGITALHNAICAGHSEVVRFLVDFGCDVNAQDSDGWTPLHCAASCNNVGMAKFLVERGACIFATTLSDHETAAEKCEEDEDGFGPCSEYLYSIQEKLGISNGGVVYSVFEYEAQNPDELSFGEGERLSILRKGDEMEREWWWTKSEAHNEGYVPRNLLGLYPRVHLKKRKVDDC